MELFFTIVLLMSVLGLSIGLVKPKWIVLWHRSQGRTRKKVLLEVGLIILGSIIILFGLIFSWILSLIILILAVGTIVLISMLIGFVCPSVIRTLGKRTRKNIAIQYTGFLILLLTSFVSVTYVGVSIVEDDEEIILGKYVGDRSQGLKSGQGHLFNQSSYYEGHWADDQRSGFGKEVVDLGLLAYFEYEGQWKNNQEHGKGKGIIKVLWMSTEYEGEWRNGKREGYGKFIDRNGNTYQGEWVNGSPEGKGEMTLSNGETYRGEVSGFQRHGFGKAVLEGGEVKEGEWIEGEFVE